MLAHRWIAQFLVAFRRFAGALTLACAASVPAAELTAIDAVEPRLIEWRRDFHQHPELGNREQRTAERILAALRDMGLDVRSGIAETGVVAVLRGGKPGPTIALRADMDALPVTEPPGLPFASKVRTTFNGIDTGVMHACGHDAHMAILLATAELLAAQRATWPGTLYFVFQPAEEGPPVGETGGAERMLDEGVFASGEPDFVLGLHVTSTLQRGVIGVRSGPTMAASDNFSIVIRGQQAHAGRPWQGVDPISVAAQVVLGANQIISRQIDLATAPAVLSFGAIQGGLRENIIPGEVRLIGTFRTFTPQAREEIGKRLKRSAEHIAEAAGASAEFESRAVTPVLVNDPSLSLRAEAALAANPRLRVVQTPFITSSEDFAYFAARYPSFFFRLGITAPDLDPNVVAGNHAPGFMIDEASLRFGVEAYLTVLADLAQSQQP